MPLPRGNFALISVTVFFRGKASCRFQGLVFAFKSFYIHETFSKDHEVFDGF